MKKCKKTVVWLLLIAMLSTLLSACGKSKDGTIGKKALDFNEVYKDSFTLPFDLGYTSSQTLTLGNNVVGGYCFVQYLDSSTNKYNFYNVDTNSVVLTIDKSKIANESDLTLYDGYIKVIETDGDTKTTSIYGANGKLMASAGGSAAVSITDDGFTLGQKFYYIENGAVKKEYTVPPFTQINDSYTFTDDYVIYRKDDRTTVYYNEQFEEVAAYELPGGSAHRRSYLLENDMLLVQYSLQCDSNAKKYDFIDDDKYTLHTFLFNPEKNKPTKLDLNVYICDVLNAKTRQEEDKVQFEDIFTDKVENVLSYYAITDKLIDKTATHCVLLGNDGKIGATLSDYVEDQKGMISPLSDGYYYAPVKDGYAILNGKGKLLHKVPNIGTATDYGYCYDNRFYNENNKIYNKNFEMQVEFSSVPHSGFIGGMNTTDAAAFYAKEINGETHYYRYDKNGESEIKAPDGRKLAQYSTIGVYDGYYVVVSEDIDGPYSSVKQHDFYGMNGQLLLSISGNTSNPYTKIATGDNAVLISYQENGNTVYQRFAK